MWMSNLRRYCLLLLPLCLLMLSLSGCMSDTTYAPVVNAWHQPAAKSGAYRVRKGDTVYSIAWAFGLDYRALAAANNLRAPYEIHPGQKLRMTTQRRHEKIVKVYVANQHTSKNYVAKRKQAVSYKRLVWRSKPMFGWQWPARGRVVQGFSASRAGNKGINIAGRLGEPIRAAAAGRVVYSGDGLRAYGNLLIIKHNDSYLSAYAYNKKLLVAVGQWVRRGQMIATMGRNDAGRSLLHFEIRRNGRPINPMLLLKR